jgi:hypothetical protein
VIVVLEKEKNLNLCHLHGSDQVTEKKMFAKNVVTEQSFQKNK